MAQDRLCLAVIQDNPTVGDIDGNIDMAIAHLRENLDADLVVFPECFVSGYPLGDLVLRPGFLVEVRKGLDRLQAEVIKAQGPAVLIGAPLAGAELPWNAALLIEPSGATRVVRKTELPNADVFDERRTFASAERPPEPLPFRGFRLGVMICEDMWHGRVTRALADELADVLLVLNGSPYQRGKQPVREAHARARVRATGLPLIYANLVGGQDELVFDGRSFAMQPGGETCTAGLFRPDVMRLVLEKAAGGALVHLDPRFEPSPQVEDGIASDYAACVLGLRDYMRKTGMPHAFVGVSGGLDSALVLAMAVDALGRDRVTGVMMPSAHTGRESLDLADDLMRRLGVHRATIPILDGVSVMDEAIGAAAAGLAAGLRRDPAMGIARENVQSRLRGMTLMGLSNALGGIVLSTGNKSEMSVGYATLYGDMCGGFNPLKSVYKSDAFKMAEWRNATTGIALDMTDLAFVHDPIPAGIISRPPTAELAEGQTDQASLGDYDLLDMVLKCLVEERMDAASAARALEARFGRDDVWRRSGGYHPDTYAAKIGRLVRIAQYKRDQSPPGVKLNATDFGLGWRYPIAGDYRL